MIYATSFAALFLGALHLFLTLDVIKRRRMTGIYNGTGNDEDLIRKIRGHANLAEQLPITLILLAVAEIHLPGIVVWIGAIVFIIARVLHAIQFTFKDAHYLFRILGMIGTFFTQTLALVLILIGVFT